MIVVLGAAIRFMDNPFIRTPNGPRATVRKTVVSSRDTLKNVAPPEWFFHRKAPAFSRLILTTGIAAMLAGPQPLRAATYTWDANTNTTGAQDGGGVWNTSGANWWTGSANIAWTNTNTAVAVFGGASGTAGTVSVGSSVTCGGIIFNATASGSYTLAGGYISVGSTSGTITANANATISSSLYAGALNKAGAGTLTLSNFDNEEDSLTVDYGKLVISGVVLNNYGYVGASAGTSGTVTVVGGGAWHKMSLNFLMDWLYIGISGTGTVNLNGGIISGSTANFGFNAGSVGIANVSSGTWSSTSANFIGIYGAGFLNLSGGVMTDAFGCLGYYAGGSGTATITGGVWNNSASLVVGNYGAGALAISGGTVSAPTSYVSGYPGASGTASISGGTWNNTQALYVGSGGAGTLTVTGSGNVVVGSGTGTVTLAPSAGSIGTLNIGNGESSGTLSAGAIVGGSGAATVNFNQPNSLTFTPAITGTTAINKLGTGTVILAGSNSSSGPITVATGTLQLGTSGTGIAFSGTTGPISGGTGSVLVLNCGGNIAIPSILGDLGVLQMGSASLTLTGSNSLNAGVAMNNGLLILGNAGALGTSGPLSFGGGILQYSASNQADYSGRIVNSAGAIFVDTNGQNVAFASSLPASNTGGLVKLGAGTLTLGASNAFTGAVAINGGVLSLCDANALPTAGAISFSGGSLQYSTRNQMDFSGRIANSTGAISVDTNGQDVTFASDLASSNTGGMVKLGAGTLRLCGSNASTGPVMIIGGTLNLSNANACKNGTVTLAGGAVLFGSATTGSAYTFGGLSAASSGGTFDILLRDAGGVPVTLAVGGNNANTIYNGALGGPGSLIKTGTGTLLLSGSSTYTGLTVLAGGAVNLGAPENPGASGPLGVSGFITLNGGFLQYSAANQFDYSGRFSTAGNQQYNADTNGQNVTWAAALVSAGGSLTKSGSGTLLLTGSNAYSGATVLNGGVIGLGSAEQPGTSGPLGLTGTIVLNGGTIQHTPANQYDYSGRFSTGPNQHYNIDTNGQDVTWAASLGSPGGSLLKIGSGTLTLTGSNSYSGATQIAGGTVLLANQYALQNSPVSLGNSTLIFDDSVAGAFALAALSGSSGEVALQDSHGLPIALTVGANNADTSYGGIFSGPGSLAKIGAGTLVLSGSSTYAGLTAVAGGVVQIAGAESPGTAGPLGLAGTILLTGGCLQYTASNQFDYSTRFSAAPNQQYLVNTNGQNVIWAAALTSVGTPLTKSGSGTLTLSGSNRYTGVTTISGGIVNLGAPEIPGVSGPLGFSGTIAFNGGWLQYSPANQFDYSSRFSIAPSQQYNVDTNGQNVTWAAALTGSGGSLAKTGAGTLTLTGSSTYGGGITIAGGTLQLGDGAIANGSVAGNMNDNAVVVFANPTAQSYAGSISGSGAFLVTGPGTLTLSGSSSFFGTTSVNSGTLSLASQYAMAASSLSCSSGSLGFDSSVAGHTFKVGALSGTANLTALFQFCRDS